MAKPRCSAECLNHAHSIKMSYYREPCSETCEGSLVGGKAKNLWLLGQKVAAAPVPPWFVLTTEAFASFLHVRNEKNCIITHRNSICNESREHVIISYKS